MIYLVEVEFRHENGDEEIHTALCSNREDAEEQLEKFVFLGPQSTKALREDEDDKITVRDRIQEIPGYYVEGGTEDEHPDRKACLITQSFTEIVNEFNERFSPTQIVMRPVDIRLSNGSTLLGDSPDATGSGPDGTTGATL